MRAEHLRHVVKLGVKRFPFARPHDGRVAAGQLRRGYLLPYRGDKLCCFLLRKALRSRIAEVQIAAADILQKLHALHRLLLIASADHNAVVYHENGVRAGLHSAFHSVFELLHAGQAVLCLCNAAESLAFGACYIHAVKSGKADRRGAVLMRVDNEADIVKQLVCRRVNALFARRLVLALPFHRAQVYAHYVLRHSFEIVKAARGY